MQIANKKSSPNAKKEGKVVSLLQKIIIETFSCGIIALISVSAVSNSLSKTLSFSLSGTRSSLFRFQSANRDVIQKRLKRSGQRWAIEGAQRVANLRGALKSKRWNSVLHLIKPTTNSSLEGNFVVRPLRIHLEERVMNYRSLVNAHLSKQLE